MPYITSTMSTGVKYAVYGQSAGGLPIVKKEIEIKGGANVADKALYTPNGVVTKVSDDELDLLKANPVFQLHVKAGYLKISKLSGENTKNLEVKDTSAQLTPEDFKKKGKKAPKTKG